MLVWESDMALSFCVRGMHFWLMTRRSSVPSDFALFGFDTFLWGAGGGYMLQALKFDSATSDKKCNFLIFISPYKICLTQKNDYYDDLN